MRAGKPRIDWFPYLLMAPGVLLGLFATLYPIVFVVNYSLFKTQVFQFISFTGFQNYQRLFTDPRFLENILNSLFFVFVGIILTWMFGLSLALFLRRQSWGSAIVRAIILIPWVTNHVVVALMWKWLLAGEASPINAVLSSLGIPPFNPLISLSQALPTLTLINAWRAAGFAMLLMLAGLAAIPKELDEAAEADGASRFQHLRYIILPLLRPISMVCMVTLTISFFNIVILPLDLTGGGPLYSTELMSIRLYREGFQNYNIAMASTMTVVLVALDLILAGLYFRLIRSKAYGQ